MLPATDVAFTSVFIVPSVSDTGSADAPDATTNVVQHVHLPTSTPQRADFVQIIDPVAAAPSPPGSPEPTLHCRLRAVFPLGRIDE